MRPSGFCLLLLLLALTFFLPLFSLSRGVAGAAPALTTKRERLYTVTGEAFTADGFAIYRLNGGDSSSLYFPTIYRARPGIRDLVGLNTVQFPSTQGSDIVTIRTGGLLTAVTFGNNQNDDSPSWSSMQELILARTYPLDGEAERGNLVVIEGEYYLGTTTTPITQNDNLKRDFQWSPTDAISYLETTPQGRTDLWVAPAGTFAPTVVLTDVIDYRWSPTGNAIAFTANRDGDSDLFLSTPDGATITPLTDNTATDELFEWVEWGNSILIRRPVGNLAELRMVHLQGNFETIFSAAAEINIPLERSPDIISVAYLVSAEDGGVDLRIDATIAPPPFAGDNPLWHCPPDPDCWMGDVAWSSDSSKVAWRTTYHTPTTQTLETDLVYRNRYKGESHIITEESVPEGLPVWATGTEWLIFAATTPDTPTTNLFAQNTDPENASVPLQISSGTLNVKPTDWREIIQTPGR